MLAKPGFRDDDFKRIKDNQLTELTQDFRSFDFLSPWEGMTNVMLPGDEKAEAQSGSPARAAQPGSNK